RLHARLSALAFQALDEGRLLAALVRAGTAMEVELDVDAGAQDVLAHVARRVGLLERLGQDAIALVEFAANVDVADLRPDAVAGDDARLDELMRILLHDEPVLVRPRLAFVGVHAEIARRAVLG